MLDQISFPEFGLGVKLEQVACESLTLIDGTEDVVFIDVKFQINKKVEVIAREEFIMKLGYNLHQN